MTLPAYALPFGLRDVKLAPLNSDGVTYGASVDLPASMTLSFAESQDSEELRGDDVTIASHGNAPTVTWSLEAGGISLDAYKVLVGGTLTTSGVSPASKKTLNKKGTDQRPYFKIEGQIISDSGGDVHAVIYKAKATGDVGGDFQEGQFYLTDCDGTGYTDANGNLYDLVHNETAVANT